MKTTITRESRCDRCAVTLDLFPLEARERCDANVLKETFATILKSGKFVHCIELTDIGSDGHDYVSSIKIFTEPDLCKHSSVEECAAFFARHNPGFWSATHPDLKSKIEKILYDKYLSKLLNDIHKLYKSPLSAKQKIKELEEYIKSAYAFLESQNE